MSTAERVASIIGGVGAVTGIAGLVVSIVSIRYVKRSTAHAGESAVESRRLREIEADRRVEEKERRHEDLAPNLPGELELEFRANERLGGGHGSLFGAITLPRGHRVKAEALMVGGSRSELSLGMVTAADREVGFQVEPWHPEQEKPRTEEIVFRFWPPVEGADDVPAWGCGCGRPTGEGMDGPGHWERRVTVSYQPVENQIF